MVMETDQNIYYLNSLEDTGKLEDLFDKEHAPIFVLEAFLRLKKQFNSENLLEYFRCLDQWEEMIQNDYIGDIYEVIHEDSDKIIVEFSDPDYPTKKEICSYFLA